MLEILDLRAAGLPRLSAVPGADDGHRDVTLGRDQLRLDLLDGSARFGCGLTRYAGLLPAFPLDDGNPGRVGGAVGHRVRDDVLGPGTVRGRAGPAAGRAGRAERAASVGLVPPDLAGCFAGAVVGGDGGSPAGLLRSGGHSGVAVSRRDAAAFDGTLHERNHPARTQPHPRATRIRSPSRDAARCYTGRRAEV